LLNETTEPFISWKQPVLNNEG